MRCCTRHQRAPLGARVCWGSVPTHAEGRAQDSKAPERCHAISVAMVTWTCCGYEQQRIVRNGTRCVHSLASFRWDVVHGAADAQGDTRRGFLLYSTACTLGRRLEVVAERT